MESDVYCVISMLKDLILTKKYDSLNNEIGTLCKAILSGDKMPFQMTQKDIYDIIFNDTKNSNVPKNVTQFIKFMYEETWNDENDY